MKKLLAFIPMVAGVAWAGTTYVAGSQAEPAYIDLIAQLNENIPVPFVVESYEKGFLKSTAITQIMSSGKPDAVVTMRLKHEIDHSTVAMDDAGARVGKSAIRTTALFDHLNDPDVLEALKAFNGAEPFELFTSVGMDGVAENLLKINPAKLSKDEVTIEFTGSEIAFNVTDDLSVVGGGGYDSVTWTDNRTSGSYSTQGAEFAVDLTKHASGLYEGTQRYGMQSFSVEDPFKGVAVQLKDMTLDTEVVVNGSKADSGMNWVVGNIESPFPVNAVQMNFTVKGFSAAELAQLQKGQRKGGPADLVDAKAKMELFAKAIPGGAKFNWKIKASNDGGDVNGDLSINRLDGAADISWSMTVRDALASFAGELRLNGDAAALDLTPLGGMLQSPPATDFISFDGKKYSGAAVLADNIITVNGNPIPVEFMFGGLMDMTLENALAFAQ